jgi:hypothetical protein
MLRRTQFVGCSAALVGKWRISVIRAALLRTKNPGRERRAREMRSLR